MNLFRILLVLGAAWLIWRFYKSLKSGPGNPSPPSQGAPTYEPMARCTKCDVHAPAGSLSSSGRCGRCSE